MVPGTDTPELLKSSRYNGRGQGNAELRLASDGQSIFALTDLALLQGAIFDRRPIRAKQHVLGGVTELSKGRSKTLSLLDEEIDGSDSIFL